MLRNVLQDAAGAQLAAGEKFKDLGCLLHWEAVHDGTHLALCGELKHGTHLLAVAEE